MTTPTNNNSQKYWKANIRLLLALLAIWFFVSFGMGILWVDWLDQFSLFGFPLGFWFAQQGSIYIFVIIIFIYAYAANKLDKRYGFDEVVEKTEDIV